MTMTSTVRADALTELEHDLVLRLCVMHTERLSGSLSISGIGIEENRLRLRSPLRWARARFGFAALCDAYWTIIGVAIDIGYRDRRNSITITITASLSTSTRLSV
jgi:hypothetical protein